MTEGDLKRKLCKAVAQAMPGAVIFRHEDKFSAGVPDVSITWGGVTTWWEVKFEPLGQTSRPTKLQLYTLERLAKQGHAGLILYRERKREGGKNSHVWLADNDQDTVKTIPGYDHGTVARLINKVHLFPSRKEALL